MKHSMVARLILDTTKAHRLGKWLDHREASITVNVGALPRGPQRSPKKDKAPPKPGISGEKLEGKP